MKLSKAQQKIIELMKEGWELGRSTSFASNRAWVQQDGVGRGGKSEKMSISTFCVLLDKKLIELKKDGFPTSKYQLTELGKNQ